MIIRREQLASFARPVAYDLECRITKHVTRAFAARCTALGEREVRRRAREGMAQAGRYGIEGGYDIPRFVDLTFLLGPKLATGAELAELFGPVACYVMEGEDPDTVLQFELAEGALTRHESPRTP